MQRIKKLFLKRLALFRVIFYGSIILIIYTSIRYTNNVNYAKYITPVYFLQNKATLNVVYNVAGVVKPGSLQIIKGSDELTFIMTDFEHEIRVLYKGPIPPNFVEGDTSIISGHITDVNKPNIFLASQIESNHGYDINKWNCILLNT
jgi:cytochrome c-type biogenesis protein CcmE